MDSNLCIRLVVHEMPDMIVHVKGRIVGDLVDEIENSIFLHWDVAVSSIKATEASHMFFKPLTTSLSN